MNQITEASSWQHMPQPVGSTWFVFLCFVESKKVMKSSSFTLEMTRMENPILVTSTDFFLVCTKSHALSKCNFRAIRLTMLTLNLSCFLQPEKSQRDQTQPTNVFQHTGVMIPSNARILLLVHISKCKRASLTVRNPTSDFLFLFWEFAPRYHSVIYA